MHLSIMEYLRQQLLEIWDHTLLSYRTFLIRTESKRRKSIAYTKDWSRKGRHVFCAHHGHNLSRELRLTDGSSSDCSSASGPASGTSSAGPSSPTARPAMEFKHCDRTEMKRVFDLFDENKDGLISAEELQLYMRRLGAELSDQSVRDMVKTVDKNGDDFVDFEEFLSLYSPLGLDIVGEGVGEGSIAAHHSARSVSGEDDYDEALLGAFFVFDENKDGQISGLELQQVLLKLGLPEGKSLMGCQMMIERVDSDGNGMVDFFEFKDMMSSDALSGCKCI